MFHKIRTNISRSDVTFMGRDPSFPGSDLTFARSKVSFSRSDPCFARSKATFHGSDFTFARSEVTFDLGKQLNAVGDYFFSCFGNCV